MGLSPSRPLSSIRPATKVLVATTAMLAFISYWRAAAIVLNDLASSAYYAGGESEQFIGKTAPWFILGTMLLSYAVSQLYIESCSMFVRGGVYRVVKEAMGGALAKFSVSALMFDYILTGPISGVSAGQYLAGLINEMMTYTHMRYVISANGAAEAFAIAATLYFWWENIKGIPESSEKALWIMQLTTVMVVALIGWCTYTLLVRGGHLPPLPLPRNIVLGKHALGLALRKQDSANVRSGGGVYRAGALGAGDERRGIAGAGVSRDRASETAEPEKSGADYFRLQPGVHFAGFVLRGNDHPGRRAAAVFRKPDRRPGDESAGAVRGAAGIPHICGGGGHADSVGRGEHGHCGIEWSAESRFRGWRAFGLVPRTAPAVWNVLPDHQHGGGAADRDDPDQPRRRDISGEPVRVRRDLEFCAERHGGAGVALHATAGTRIQSAAEFSRSRDEKFRWAWR